LGKKNLIHCAVSLLVHSNVNADTQKTEVRKQKYSNRVAGKLFSAAAEILCSNSCNSRLQAADQKTVSPRSKKCSDICMLT